MGIKRTARSLNRFCKEIVERCENVAACCVVTLGEFLRLGRMTGGTITRRHNCGDMDAVVVVAIDISFAGLVALNTAHALSSVCASLPVGYNAGVRLLMALNTLMAALGNHGQ